jgi:hypothetical protein
VTVRDVTAKRTLVALEGDPVRRPPLSPNGKYLALATRAGKVMLIELATGKTTAATCGTPGSLAFDKTSGTLAVGSTDRVCLMKVPSLETIRTTAVMRGPDDPKDQIIRDLHFFADDRALIGNTEDTVGLVYEAASGRLLWKRSGCQPVLERDRTTFLCRDPANEGPNRYVGVKFDRDLRIEEESNWDQKSLDVIGKRLWEARVSAPLREALARIAPEVCAVNERLLVPKAECSLSRASRAVP